jgi:hypothetical protein
VGNRRKDASLTLPNYAHCAAAFAVSVSWVGCAKTRRANGNQQQGKMSLKSISLTATALTCSIGAAMAQTPGGGAD